MGEWEHDLQHEFTDEDEPHPYTGKRPSEMKGWEGPDWRADDNYNGLEVGEPEPGEEVPDYSVDEEWAEMSDQYEEMIWRQDWLRRIPNQDVVSSID